MPQSEGPLARIVVTEHANGRARHSVRAAKFFCRKEAQTAENRDPNLTTKNAENAKSLNHPLGARLRKRSCIFFFFISPLTGRNSPLKPPNVSLISEIVDTSG
jgi:hypothetical protein